METKPKINYVKDSFADYLGKTNMVSASDLKLFLSGPAIYFYKKFQEPKSDNPERHFAIGSAIHECILEPQEFLKHYFVIPKVSLISAAGKAEYAKAQLKAEGKTIIFDDEMQMINKIVNNVTKNKTFMALIKDSYREVSCYTIDEKTGLEVRLRPDILCNKLSNIIDIKSCLDSSKKGFKRDVYAYSYSLTDAYYSDFLNRENYLFFAVEKEEPRQCCLYALNDEMKQYGRTQYRMGLDLLKFCKDNNYYPAYDAFELLKEYYELNKDFGPISKGGFFQTLEASELITII